MNFFSFSSALVSVSTIILGIILLISSYRPKSNVIWSFFCFSVAIWGVGGFIASSTSSYADSLFWWKVANIGSILCPILFFHFVLEYLRIKKSFLFYFSYVFVALLLYVNLFHNRLFFSDLSLVGNKFYYMDWTITKNPLYLLFYIYYYWFILLYSFFLIVKSFLSASGMRRYQMWYFLVGMTIGWIGGHADFLYIFGFKVYPYLNILIAVYPIILGYAMSRYQLMDIKIAFTRAAIFIFVYSLVLGFPFILGYKFKLWFHATWTMLFLATAGPFIYLFIQRKTEDALLQEQRRYQSTLRQASAGMGKIKDLHKLLNLIVYVVARAVRLEHALIYILDYSEKQFKLGAFKKRSGKGDFIKSIPMNSALILYFSKNNLPIVYDEVKQRAQDNNDVELNQIEKVIKDVQGSLIFPILIDKNLTGIVVLGKKESGKIYGEEDISVFTILSNQAALAIENAQFYEDMKKTHEQLFQAEKMATIGTMADGLSHQINNRFHALGFIAGDALDTIKLNKNKEMPPELKEMINDLERAITRIQENVVQGGEVVQGLLRYTRKGDAGFEAIDFDKAFTSAFDMAQFKIKTHELKVVRLYDSAQIPKIKGNFTQLQEVFFNLIDNGYDAMMQRKNELKEPGFQPTLTITVTSDSPNVKIIFEDNGMGVKEEDIHKLFTPFFTTKLSSKKGTGLGLYVIKKIIEENHKGSVEMVSEYMKGTQMVITLPLARI